MTVQDYTPYVTYARRQAAQRQKLAEARYRQAWEIVQAIADFLRRKYSPTRILVFGSLVHSHTFSVHSDIDIAVEGIPWPDYLRAWNDVESLFPVIPVDLIDMATISERFRQRIEEDGVQL